MSSSTKPISSQNKKIINNEANNDGGSIIKTRKLKSYDINSKNLPKFENIKPTFCSNRKFLETIQSPKLNELYERALRCNLKKFPEIELISNDGMPIAAAAKNLTNKNALKKAGSKKIKNKVAGAENVRKVIRETFRLPCTNELCNPVKQLILQDLKVQRYKELILATRDSQESLKSKKLKKQMEHYENYQKFREYYAAAKEKDDNLYSVQSKISKPRRRNSKIVGKLANDCFDGEKKVCVESEDPYEYLVEKSLETGIYFDPDEDNFSLRRNKSQILKCFKELLSEQSSDTSFRLLNEDDVKLLKNIVHADDQYRKIEKEDQLLLKEVLKSQLSEIEKQQEILGNVLETIRSSGEKTTNIGNGFDQLQAEKLMKFVNISVEDQSTNVDKITKCVNSYDEEHSTTKIMQNLTTDKVAIKTPQINTNKYQVFQDIPAKSKSPSEMEDNLLKGEKNIQVGLSKTALQKKSYLSSQKFESPPRAWETSLSTSIEDEVTLDSSGLEMDSISDEILKPDTLTGSSNFDQDTFTERYNKVLKEFALKHHLILNDGQTLRSENGLVEDSRDVRTDSSRKSDKVGNTTNNQTSKHDKHISAEGSSNICQNNLPSKILCHSKNASESGASESKQNKSKTSENESFVQFNKDFENKTFCNTKNAGQNISLASSLETVKADVSEASNSSLSTVVTVVNCKYMKDRNRRLEVISDLGDDIMEAPKQKLEEKAKEKLDKKPKQKLDGKAKRKFDDKEKRKLKDKVKPKLDDGENRTLEGQVKQKLEHEVKLKFDAEAKKRLFLSHFNDVKSKLEDEEKKIEDETSLKLKVEINRKLEDKVRLKLENKAKQKHEDKEKVKRENLAKLKLENEAKRMLEDEAKRKPENKTKRKSEDETKRKPEDESKLIPEDDAKRKPEHEPKRTPVDEAKRKPEHEPKRTPVDEAKLKFENQAKLKFENQAKLKFENQAKLWFENQAKLKFENQAKLWFENQAKIQFEDQAKRKLEDQEKQKLENKVNQWLEHKAKQWFEHKTKQWTGDADSATQWLGDKANQELEDKVVSQELEDKVVNQELEDKVVNQELEDKVVNREHEERQVNRELEDKVVNREHNKKVVIEKLEDGVVNEKLEDKKVIQSFDNKKIIQRRANQRIEDKLVNQRLKRRIVNQKHQSKAKQRLKYNVKQRIKDISEQKLKNNLTKTYEFQSIGIQNFLIFEEFSVAELTPVHVRQVICQAQEFRLMHSSLDHLKTLEEFYIYNETNGILEPKKTNYFELVSRPDELFKLLSPSDQNFDPFTNELIIQSYLLDSKYLEEKLFEVYQTCFDTIEIMKFESSKILEENLESLNNVKLKKLEAGDSCDIGRSAEGERKRKGRRKDIVNNPIRKDRSQNYIVIFFYIMFFFLVIWGLTTPDLKCLD